MSQDLEQPFAEADTKDIPCILDTDTTVKSKKYTRCGMELCGEKKLKNGISLYTMAYNKINMDSGNEMFQMLDELR